MSTNPVLRPLEIRRTVYAGTPMFALRDPLQIGTGLLVPQALAPLLAELDGTHSPDDLGRTAALYYGQDGASALADLLDALDSALLLDNVTFADAHAAALHAYRAAPHRPLSHADAVYPSDPAELRAMVDQYLAHVAIQPIDAARGVWSPHIDYARGGAIYADVWQRAAPVANACDLVILLATDHGGPPGTLTLTRQQYATPFGVLPTPLPLMDACAAAIGEDAAYAGELRHRSEHSIELVAVWLHAVRQGRPVELLPVLVGSFADFVSGSADPAAHAPYAALLDTIAAHTKHRNVLYVVSGDLSHVGPAFGGRALNAAAKQRLHAADDAVLAALCSGDATHFFGTLQSVQDRNNVCGLPPGYLALRALAPANGHVTSYAQCPADDADTSVVSVAGVIWT